MTSPKAGFNKQMEYRLDCTALQFISQKKKTSQRKRPSVCSFLLKWWARWILNDVGRWRQRLSAAESVPADGGRSWPHCNRVRDKCLLKMESKEWFRRLEQNEANVMQPSLTDRPYRRRLMTCRRGSEGSEWIMYSWNKMNWKLLKELWLHQGLALK